MHELISHLGLRFYLFDLQGALRYTHTRNGKAPKVYEICKSDIDDGDGSDSSSSENTAEVKPGRDASAVGMRLRLLKNDGLLKIEFEGENGAAARWTFEGLELLGGGKMVAVATTQTDFDPGRYHICGEEKRQTVDLRDGETQTDTKAVQSTETQKKVLPTSSIGVQVTPTAVPLHRQVSKVVEILGPFIDTPAAQILIRKAVSDLEKRVNDARKVFNQHAAAREDSTLLDKELKNIAFVKLKLNGPRTDSIQTSANPSTYIKTIPSTCTSIGTQTRPSARVDVTISPLKNDQKTLRKDILAPLDLKRKASTTRDPREPLHKRAKSRHGSPAWPRHLYMTCFRSYPIFKGDVGTLHIDVKEATVWFEGWYGKPHVRMFERKQIDLRDPETRVYCKRFKVDNRGHSFLAVDDATYMLDIWRLNAKLEPIRMLEAHCCAPGWETWGSHEVDGTHLPIADTRVVIEAIVHCIDVTSRREAIHSPDTMHKLEEDLKQYARFQEARSLTKGDMLSWEFTTKELKRREQRVEALMLCEMPDMEEKDEEDGAVDAGARRELEVDPMDVSKAGDERVQVVEDLMPRLV